MRRGMLCFLLLGALTAVEAPPGWEAVLPLPEGAELAWRGHGLLLTRRSAPLPAGDWQQIESERLSLLQDLRLTTLQLDDQPLPVRWLLRFRHDAQDWRGLLVARPIGDRLHSVSVLGAVDGFDLEAALAISERALAKD